MSLRQGSRWSKRNLHNSTHKKSRPFLTQHRIKQQDLYDKTQEFMQELQGRTNVDELVNNTVPFLEKVLLHYPEMNTVSFMKKIKSVLSTLPKLQNTNYHFSFYLTRNIQLFIKLYTLLSFVVTHKKSGSVKSSMKGTKGGMPGIDTTSGSLVSSDMSIILDEGDVVITISKATFRSGAKKDKYVLRITGFDPNADPVTIGGYAMSIINYIMEQEIDPTTIETLPLPDILIDTLVTKLGNIAERKQRLTSSLLQLQGPSEEEVRQTEQQLEIKQKKIEIEQKSAEVIHKIISNEGSLDLNDFSGAFSTGVIVAFLTKIIALTVYGYTLIGLDAAKDMAELQKSKNATNIVTGLDHAWNALNDLGSIGSTVVGIGGFLIHGVTHTIKHSPEIALDIATSIGKGVKVELDEGRAVEEILLVQPRTEIPKKLVFTDIMTDNLITPALKTGRDILLEPTNILSMAALLICMVICLKLRFMQKQDVYYKALLKQSELRSRSKGGKTIRKSKLSHKKTYRK